MLQWRDLRLVPVFTPLPDFPFSSALAAQNAQNTAY